MTRRIAFVWDNFGPLHVDRCNAVARHFGAGVEVLGIELFARSELYDWDNPPAEEFRKVTLFANRNWGDVSAPSLSGAITSALAEQSCDTAFFAHYDRFAILLAALRARRAGLKVFTMGCSKYDDRPRKAWREWGKRQFMRPYAGAIAAHDRSIDYMRHLGMPADRVVSGYNTVDQDRIRGLAAVNRSAEPPFASRPFLAVTRLVWEKNLPLLLDSYAAYRKAAENPRQLQIAGSGPLERDLRAKAEDLGIAGNVDWLGFAQCERVAVLMRDALCLLLPSVSETFGNVVPEALALGLPVIASTQCGATDRLVVDGVSGFTFHARDRERLTQLLLEVGADEASWHRLKTGARDIAPLGDAARLAEAVAALI